MLQDEQNKGLALMRALTPEQQKKATIAVEKAGKSIEFDHQNPVAACAGRRHIHTVVRTPNGNDYGKDLLRQHYEMHRHDPSHGH